MRTHPLRLIAGFALLLVAFGASGAFAAGELVPADRTFFLRGSGCGASESFWLSTQSGTDDYDGCGIIGGLPVNELIHQVDGPTPNSFAAQNGVPAIIDATRNLNGQIKAESWFGDDIPGIGQVVVEVSLTGINVNNQFVGLGTASVEVLNTGTDGVIVPFSIDLPDSAQGVELKALTLDVEVHGVNWNSGNLGLEGESKFTLPILKPAV